jgi:predicted esterase
MKAYAKGARALAPMVLALAVSCTAGTEEGSVMGSLGAPPLDESMAGGGGSAGSPVGMAGAGGSALPGNGPDGEGTAPDGGTTPGNDGAPQPGTPDAGPPATPAGDPVIPALTAQCPAFVDGTVTFMGLAGVQIMAGPKPGGPTAPLVFYWHGTGGESAQFERYTALAEGVRAQGGVLISFQSSAGPDQTSGTFIWGAGDLPLVDQLVACAVRDHNVDPRRIYTTGCSAGGLFSAALAAERSQYIAAAATDSGGWLGPILFQNDYTPALMTIHGAAGTDVVVVDFSVTSKTADDGYGMRGGFVVDCNHGGGHCKAWAEGLDADMWAFLEAHPYGVAPYPWQGGLPSFVSPSCGVP